MKTFCCTDCRESYPMNERYTLTDLPRKQFCEGCFEERLECYRVDEMESEWWSTGMGQSEFFGGGL